LSNVIGEFRRFGEDDEIIEIGGHETIKKIVEGVIHKVLQRSWSIHEFEMHDYELVRSISRLKHSFPFVPISNSNQVVARLAPVQNQDFLIKKMCKKLLENILFPTSIFFQK